MSGDYTETHWTHAFSTETATDLEPLQRELLEPLATHHAFIRRVVDEGGRVELFCGVFPDGNWDEILDHALLGALASLRIDLRFDVYPRQEGDA